jgi:hypothetical protein
MTKEEMQDRRDREIENHPVKSMDEIGVALEKAIRRSDRVLKYLDKVLSRR